MIGKEALSIYLPAGQQHSPSLQQHLLEKYLLKQWLTVDIADRGIIVPMLINTGTTQSLWNSLPLSFLLLEACDLQNHLPLRGAITLGIHLRAL